MNKFEQKYLSILNEAKFKSNKWIKSKNFKNIEVFENFKHLSNRLKTRYKVEFDNWLAWNFISSQIINYFLENESWLNCSTKNPYQRGFTVHLSVSNMWLSGELQNDLEDNVKRIYFSTFLPEKPNHNKHDIFIKLPL